MFLLITNINTNLNPFLIRHIYTFHSRYYLFNLINYN